MGVTAFGYTYSIDTMEADIDAVTGGGDTASNPSVHVGDDQGIPLAPAGGLVDVTPLAEEWQQVIDTVANKMLVRDNDLESFLAAWFQVSQTTGVLSGTGTVAAPHGVVNAPQVVLWVGAWCQIGTAAAPIFVSSVDAVNVNLTGGAAGAPYRMTMIFSSVASGW